MNFKSRFFRLLVAAVLILPAYAHAAVELTPFASNGLSNPISIAVPHDGSGRMFVAEQDGDVKIVDIANGNVLGTFLSVNVSYGGEQGLLSIAFDPNFGVNAGQPGYGDFYLAFTAPGGDPELGTAPDQVLRRYSVTNPASNDASNATAVDVIRIPDLYSNHNGADLHFGPDGYLYYSMGDGGSGGDPNEFAQNTGRKTVGGHTYYLLGKLMRLDVRHPDASAGNDMCGATPGQAAEYSIPPGNPFAGSNSECGEIWLWGLRNPFRFSFDRDTGDLWIGDVGQGAWEEVDWRPLGSTDSGNYGWDRCEGNHYYEAAGSGSDCPATTTTTPPVLEYNHSLGCAITGGFRYRGPISELEGTYVYADSCSSRVWFATFNGLTWSSTLFDTLPSGYGTVVGFGEDQVGNLYLVHEAGDTIYKFSSGDLIFADGFDG